MSPLTEVEAGKVQLFSFVTPALFSGDYTIDVTQPVAAPGAQEKDKITLHTSKPFSVPGLNPYRLPPGTVYSSYPAEGETVEARILPHVTLSDPHLPWEIPIDKANESSSDFRIPWLALLVFTADELSPLDPSIPPKITSTLAVSLTKKELLGLSKDKVQIPAIEHEAPGMDDKIEAIFTTPSAFKAYFYPQRKDKDHKITDNFSLDTYGLLSHVRRIGPSGPPGSTPDSISIILGHRTGPFNRDHHEPTIAYAHLVSLAGVSGMKAPTATQMTALISLHSWTFKWASPSGGEDLTHIIKELHDHTRPLQRKNISQDAVKDEGEEWLRKRMSDGFSFVKHRLMSGETTIALYRGPLVPNRPEAGAISKAELVTHGAGLQRVDRFTGFVDISYQVAWELGRSLAFDNAAFTPALSTLRSLVTGLDQPQGTGWGLPKWMEDLVQIAPQLDQKQTSPVQPTSGPSTAATANPLEAAPTAYSSRWRTLVDRLDTKPLRRAALQKKTKAMEDWKGAHEKRKSDFNLYIKEVEEASTKHKDSWAREAPHRSDDAEKGNEHAKDSVKGKIEDILQYKRASIDEVASIAVDLGKLVKDIIQVPKLASIINAGCRLDENDWARYRRVEKAEDIRGKQSQETENQLKLSVDRLAEELNGFMLHDIRTAEADAATAVSDKAKDVKSWNDYTNGKLTEAEHHMAEADGAIKALDPESYLPLFDLGARLQGAGDLFKEQIERFINEKKATTPLGVVVTFVYDKLLCLKAVAQNYMFPEPDLLDDDSLLTFYTDPLWLDALVDGCLSVGSKGSGDDLVKNKIKIALNSYLAQDKAAAVPTWGFVLCGQYLKSVPDARIHTADDKTAPELLRTTKPGRDSLVALFNCMPERLPKGITISQPPHQQRYAAATALLDPDSEAAKKDKPYRLDLTLVAANGAADDVRKKESTGLGAIMDSKDSDYFNFATRCLNCRQIMGYYSEAGQKVLGVDSKTWDMANSSAYCSIALEDKLLELNIKASDDEIKKGKEAAVTPFKVSTQPPLTDPEIEDFSQLMFPRLDISANSTPLVVRPFGPEEAAVPRRLARLAEPQLPDPPAAQNVLSIPEDSLSVKCRLLGIYPDDPLSEEGVTTADIVVSITAAHHRADTERFRLKRLRVAFSLGKLIRLDSVPPAVELVGRNDACAWDIGSTDVASWPPPLPPVEEPRKGEEEGVATAGDSSDLREYVEHEGAVLEGSAFVVDLSPWRPVVVAELDVTFSVTRIQLVGDGSVAGGDESAGVLIATVEEYVHAAGTDGEGRRKSPRTVLASRRVRLS